jgi:hypothetical protein
MQDSRLRVAVAFFKPHGLNRKNPYSCGAGRAAYCGYADIVTAGEFVGRSALRAASGGLFPLRHGASKFAEILDICTMSQTRFQSVLRARFPAARIWPARERKDLRGHEAEKAWRGRFREHHQAD